MAMNTDKLEKELIAIEKVVSEFRDKFGAKYIMLEAKEEELLTEWEKEKGYEHKSSILSETSCDKDISNRVDDICYFAEEMNRLFGK